MSEVKRFCDGKNRAKATIKDKEQNLKIVKMNENSDCFYVFDATNAKKTKA